MIWLFQRGSELPSEKGLCFVVSINVELKQMWGNVGLMLGYTTHGLLGHVPFPF